MKNLWAHPQDPLDEHLKQVGKRCESILSNTSLNFPIKNEFLKEVVRLIGLYHDVGKATSFFQEYLNEKDGNKKLKLKNRPETKHSLLSAFFTYLAIEELCKEYGFNDDFKDILQAFSFVVVKRHHSDLITLMDDIRLDEDEREVLKVQIKALDFDYLSFLPFWDKVKEKLPHSIDNWPLSKLKLNKSLNKIDDRIFLYLLFHLLYSILLDADKHETVIGSLDNRKEIKDDLVERYKKCKGFSYENSKINTLREEIYSHVINNINSLDLNKDHILSLTAPTGSGKTLTSLGFAIKLSNKIKKEKNYIPRIIYVLPFLSIIDQNAKVIEEIFEKVQGAKPTTDLFLVHHHLSDYTYSTEDKTEFEPDESEILIEGWNSEIIITTFVQFFHTIFSNRRRAIRKFNKIAGSIVILDEIQSFPHKYWPLFKEIALKMGKYLNTFSILSTATQPAIFDTTKELLGEKEKYFGLMERTKVYLDIKRELTLAELKEKILNELGKRRKSILIVLNTIRAAKKLYSILKDDVKKLGYEIYYLSSHIVPFERAERIKEIKANSNNKVIISTQLVEAGVDIDMEKVIRDFGPMDSINQIAGRANRNWLKNEGEVEIVVLKDENNRKFYSYIYDPVLIDNTYGVFQDKKEISEKEFLEIVNKYFENVRKAISSDESKNYLNAIKDLNYEEIGKFELIEDKVAKVDIFVEINDEACGVWNEYVEIQEIDDLWERKRNFLKLKNRFYNFVISPFVYVAKKNLPPLVKGIRYVSREQLREFYDEETGFDPENKSIVW